uniref:NOC3-like protein n=1 Tax=Philodina roseola TaxID=96448 RepID=B5AHB5_PHIRO|nr:nucleolar complex associated protein [Philodina roseola]
MAKPKSRSKMSRENAKKKKMSSGKVSKQEKKFHRKVKNNVPLKKNAKIYEKKVRGKKNSDEMEKVEAIEDEEMILPLDMLSDQDEDDVDEPMKIHSENEDEDDENVESYERRPRSLFNDVKEERPLLPIKTDRGQLVPQSTPIVRKMDDDEPLVDTPAEPQEEKETKPVSIVELLAERQNKVDEAKKTIVNLCDLIMKNPYEEISNLKRLRELLNLPDPLISLTIRKLTMLSLVELFRDIVPSYRVRSLKENENDEKENLKKTKKENLSKDVKIIRHFEQTLLKHYEFFVNFLGECAKKNLAENSVKSKSQLGLLAVDCLCKLLSNLHHFNFRNNLIKMLVDLMSKNSSIVVEKCSTCLSKLLHDDRSAEFSLEIVRFLSRMLKTRSYAVEPRVLDVFLSLNIREISLIEEKKEEKASRPDYRAQKLSRRERRKHKEKRELDKMLENKTMTERQNQRAKINRQIIELIFLNYFRLLKRRLNLRLMPSVCEGLAKFANLINIEYMDDLITCFHNELTAEQTGLTRRAKFHCLITVFSILNRQQVLIHIDPQRFYALFYSLLLPSPSDDDVDLVIKLVQMMLIDRYKQLTKNKLFAFIKRLLTMTLSLQVNRSISALLVMIKALLSISPLVTDQLFDNEFSGSGIRFLAELDDPEYCNAQNSTLYEFILLRTSADKNVRQQSDEILTGKFQSDPFALRSSQENALAFLRSSNDEQKK